MTPVKFCIPLAHGMKMSNECTSCIVLGRDRQKQKSPMTSALQKPSIRESLRVFVHRTQINAPASDVYRWHLHDGAFERLSPPWETVTLEDGGQGVSNGSRRIVATKLGPFTSRWIMRHTDVIPDQQFVDQMDQGPFRAWHHMHRFVSIDQATSILEDHIRFRLPLGWLGNVVAGDYVGSQLERLFRYRHRVTVEDLAAHRQTRERGSMNILMTGSTGMIGAALAAFLKTGGHSVTGLRRGSGSSGSLTWDPSTGLVDTSAISHADAIVHLAGENIGAGRWTESRKRLIRDSRIAPTRALCEKLTQMSSPPRTLIVASAIGFYGDRGDQWLDESSGPGSGFLADLVRDWEAATEPAVSRGIRVVNLRFGIILTPKGGALQRLLLPFRMFVGGVIGTGDQYWSWVGIDDVIGAIHHALVDASIHGPVNVVAPNPVTNREFTQILARVLTRPALLPLPAFAARLAIGEMADELLLSSARIRPTKLQATGYSFRNPELEDALRHMLAR
jgi:uncharacterized protein (TIGR01777 family)